MVRFSGDTWESRGRTVLRRSLIDLLDRGERASAVIVVTAPAGTGKSTLLRSWCDEDAGRRAYLDAATDTDWIARLDAHAASGDGRTVVVDSIEAVRARTGRERLVEYVTASSGAVVLSGRDVPLVPFATAEGRPAVAVGAGELAFRADEADELLRSRGVELPRPALLSLVARAEGRAATLALAAEAIARSRDRAAALSAISSSPESLTTVLARLLLDELAPAQSQLLLALSTVPEFDAELAAVLSGRPDAIAALERIGFGSGLVGRTAGAARSEPHTRSRLEPAFRDGVLTEFIARDAIGLLRLHSVAAEWHVAEGDIEAALDQAQRSNSSELVEDLLRRFGLALVFRGSTLSVRGALAHLEDRGVLTATTGLLGALVSSPQLAESVRVDHFLALAEDEGAPRSPERDLVVAALHALHASTGPELASALARLEAAEAVTAEHPAGGGGPLAVLDARLFAEAARARVELSTGRLERALTRAVAAADSADESQLPWLELLALDTAANAANALSNWPLVGILESRIARLGSRSPEPESLVDASALLRTAAAAYRSCEPFRLSQLDDIINAQWRALDAVGVLAPRALRLLFRLDGGADPRSVFEEMEQLFAVSLRRRPETIALGAFRFLDLALLYRGRSVARDYVEQLTTALGPDSLGSVLAAALLREGTVAQDSGAAALEHALSGGSRVLEGTNLVVGWLLLAHWSAESGDEARARLRLSKALALAERMRARRPFLARQAFVRLVAERRGTFGASEAFAVSVLEAATAVGIAPEGRRAPQKSLTTRERDLLRELPLHQTVLEIAAKHSVSINTVKTHLRSIYAKVGASGRADAVRRARELGLL